jgi:hypothetical protein
VALFGIRFAPRTFMTANQMEMEAGLQLCRMTSTVLAVALGLLIVGMAMIAGWC